MLEQAPTPVFGFSEPEYKSALVYEDIKSGVYLYQQDCLELMDAIANKYPGGCFDMIFNAICKNGA
ncbi:MAG: hypothetical protein K2Q32_00405, partial [Alphaproteobacteria bacterium]|nr:hypothetical protein [Alphaproteobacteria bacterium]